MKILVYAREWTKEFYEKLVKMAFDNPQIVFISDFKGLGDIWSGKYIYDGSFDECDENYEFLKEDIIGRCRFLRRIKKEKAEELSRRFWNGVKRELETGHYDLVVSPLVDCYTMDIIERLSDQMGIPYLSVVTSFIRGYSRYTKRGELYEANREVSEMELKQVLSTLLSDEYKVTFSLNREKKNIETLKYYVKRRLVNSIYFPARKLLERDPWNYHYNTLSFQGGKYIDFSVKNGNKYYKKIAELVLQKNSVYVPLHFTPEATVDYWCDDKKWAVYEQSLIEVIEKSDKEVSFIIKEHPAMYGQRNVNFYKKLSKMDNVQIVHPYENSNQLLREVNNVLVYTGSVGVEALLRGKKVFTVTDNYYSESSSNIVKVDCIQKSELAEKTLEHDNETFMRKLLSGMFQGYSVANRDINKSDVEAMAKEMWRIYENIK